MCVCPHGVQPQITLLYYTLDFPLSLYSKAISEMIGYLMATLYSTLPFPPCRPALLLSLSPFNPLLLRPHLLIFLCPPVYFMYIDWSAFRRFWLYCRKGDKQHLIFLNCYSMTDILSPWRPVRKQEAGSVPSEEREEITQMFCSFGHSLSVSPSLVLSLSPQRVIISSYGIHISTSVLQRNVFINHGLELKSWLQHDA